MAFIHRRRNHTDMKGKYVCNIHMTVLDAFHGIGIAAVLLIVIVAGAVIGILTQTGVAMTGDALCGPAEHQHGESCYDTQNIPICSLEET